MSQEINNLNYINPINTYADVFAVYGVTDEAVAACQQYAMKLVEERIERTLRSEQSKHFHSRLGRIIKDATRQMKNLNEATLTAAMQSQNLGFQLHGVRSGNSRSLSEKWRKDPQNYFNRIHQETKSPNI